LSNAIASLPALPNFKSANLRSVTGFRLANVGKNGDFLRAMKGREMLGRRATAAGQ
jgi:hypothetical protein